MSEEKTQVRLKNTALNSCDLLKIFALVLMIVDHIGLYFYPDLAYLRAIGRSSAPIWLFFVGYFAQHRDSSKIYFAIFFNFIVNSSIAAQEIYPQTQGMGHTALLLLNYWYLLFRNDILVTIVIARAITRQAMLIADRLLSLAGAIFLLILMIPMSRIFFDYGTLIMLFSIAGGLNKAQSPYRFVVLAIAACCYIITQQYVSFHFSAQNFLIFIALFITTLPFLAFFRMYDCASNNSWLGQALRRVSRASLLIYVGHLTIFKLHIINFSELL
jgi:hypothetical protein